MTTHKRKRQHGFTLIEIMVVLIILVILMTVFGGKIFGAGDRAKANLTRIQIKQIASNIEQFRLMYNKVPSSLESLVKCTAETGDACTPLANEDSLLDGWGHPFVYTVEGDRGFRLKSLGADGKEGGTEVDSDIQGSGP